MLNILRRTALFMSTLVFMLIIAVETDFSADAATVYRYGYYSYTVENSILTVVDVAESISGDVVLPERLGGYYINGLADEALCGCSAITQLTIPKTVEFVGEGVFKGCTSLKKIITDSDNTAFSSDESGVFYTEDGTRLVAYPPANAQKEFAIPDNVSVVDKYAFYSSSSLERISISYGVREIGEGAFNNCTALTGFTVSEDNGYFCSDENGVLYNKDKTKLIQFPCGNTDSYIVPQTVTDIGSYAFSGCNLTKVHYVNTAQKWSEITVKEGNSLLSSSCFHIAQATDEVKADCVTDGYSDGAYCKECSEWLYGHEKTQSATGHSFTVYTSDKNATCSADGTKTARCDNCTALDVITHIGTKLNHSMGQWTTVRAASCTDEGVEKSTCIGCGYYKTRSTPSLNHINATQAKAKLPTCTSAGYTASEYCPDCKIWLVAKKEIPSTGHSFTVYKSNKDATYFSDGTKTARCDNCSKTHTKADKGTKLMLKTAVKLTATQTKNSVTLKWSKVSDATGYRVYVYDKSWKKLKDTKAYSCKLTKLEPGKKYKFAVKAYKTKSSKTVFAPEYKSVTVYTKPTAPSFVKAKKRTDKTVTLSWSKVNGATGYRVYLKKGKSRKALKTTTALTYTVKDLKPGTEYTFYVKPYIKYASDYIWAENEAVYTVATKPQRPAITKVVSVTKGKATLTWKDIKGETGYQIYYSTGKDSGFKKYANCTANTKKVTVNTLKSKKTYYFTIRAYTKASSGYVYSPFSEVKSVKIK